MDLSEEVTFELWPAQSGSLVTIAGGRTVLGRRSRGHEGPGKAVCCAVGARAGGLRAQRNSWGMKFMQGRPGVGKDLAFYSK